MAEITANLNWLPIGVGTVLSFLLGWLWYSQKLFGKKWAEGNNVKLPSEGGEMPVFPLLLQFVATFLLAWLIGVTAASNLLITAFLILLTIAFLIAANGVFAGKSSAAVWIESTFIIVMGIVMIGSQAVFMK
jgi:hypothetical protein